MSSPKSARDEQWAIDVWQWIVRALQYSTSHPSAIALGQRAHAELSRAIESAGSIDVGALRDSFVIDGVHASHPVLRSRFGPFLHERAVLVVRFVAGVTLAELTEFVRVAVLPPPEIFVGGGMRAMVAARHVARIEVEEISHAVVDRDKSEANRRLRDLFVEMLQGALRKAELGGGDAVAPDGAALLDLLDEPLLLARMIEASDAPGGVIGILAGLAIAVRDSESTNEGRRTRRLCETLLSMRPEARERVLMGLARLPEDAREALAEVLARMSSRELARILLPVLRLHADDPVAAFGAFVALVPVSSLRVSVLRELAQLLACLPIDEDSSFAVLEALAVGPGPQDPTRHERAQLTSLSVRLLERFRPHRQKAPPVVYEGDAFASAALEALDARIARDVVAISARKASFPVHARRLPRVGSSLLLAGRSGAALTLFEALSHVTDPRQEPAAREALDGLAEGDVADLVLRAAEALSEPTREAIARTMPIVAHAQPEILVSALEHLADRKLRHLVLEALEEAGPIALPVLRDKLHSPHWYVVRNVLTVFAKAGGVSSDVVLLASHPHVKVRVELCRALGAMTETAGVTELLATVLRDGEEEVRAAAAQVIRTLALAPGAAQILEASVLDEKLSTRARELALSVLSRAREDAAADALFRLLEAKSMLEGPLLTSLREKAAGCLLRSRAQSGAGLFEKASREGSWRVRRACEKATEESLG